MIFPLMLAVLLLSTSALAQEGPSLAEAERLAAEGNNATALAAFRQIAARNPDDHAARLWIARLHVRMQNPELAGPVYESVLLEDPANLEARLGLAEVLLEFDDPARTRSLLEPIEDAEAQNPAVLTLLARAHAVEGHDGLSSEYYARAAAADPSDTRMVRSEAARSGYAHRFETRGFSEQYNDAAPDSRAGEVILDYRLNEKWRAMGRGQIQRKLGFSDYRAGGGASWEWKPGLILRGHALLGPDNVVMPEGDYLGEIAYTYHNATWLLDVRHFDFTGARTLVVSPAVSWLASDRVSLHVRYAGSSSASNTFDSQGGHSLHVRGEHRLRPRVAIQAGYATGVEDFENFSIDKVGDFRANTISGGLRLDLPSVTSVLVGYEQQWRRNDVSVGRITLALQQAF